MVKQDHTENIHIAVVPGSFAIHYMCLRVDSGSSTLRKLTQPLPSLCFLLFLCTLRMILQLLALSRYFLPHFTFWPVARAALLKQCEPPTSQTALACFGKLSLLESVLGDCCARVTRHWLIWTEKITLRNVLLVSECLYVHLVLHPWFLHMWHVVDIVVRFLFILY